MNKSSAISTPHTILLATDLGARCDRALDRAVQLARQWRARLIALSVVDPGTLSTERVRAIPNPSWSKTAHDPVQHAFDQLRYNAGAPDVDLHLRVEEGKVGDVLMRVAEEESAGLIVTGVARSESLGHAILGSSVDWLARHSTLPVLVVRERTRGAYHSIVTPSDYSNSSRLGLEAAAALFPGTETAVFHAFTTSSFGTTNEKDLIERSTQEALQKGEEFLNALPLSPEQRQSIHVLAEHGEPVRLLYEYVRDHQIDLIALSTHGRSALFDILIGSIAKRILATAATDVLLVRDGQHQH